MCEIYNAVVIYSVVGYSIFLSLKVVILRENLPFSLSLSLSLFVRCVKSRSCGLMTRPVPACSDSVDAPYIYCLNVEGKPNSQGPTTETATSRQSDVYYQNADVRSYSFTGRFGTGGKGYCEVTLNTVIC